ncbi:hypothetical protein OHA57_00055 [Streptomyces anulatus]|nr:hypothetical protein [Streptomyces anulatus]WSC59222.1 hypothetical protein OHA57_00055 [Streptomyces anulatus]
MSNPSNFTAVCVATGTGYRLRVLSEGRDPVASTSTTGSSARRRPATA